LAVSYQLFCATGAGYETNPLTANDVQLQSVAGFGGGVTQMTVQFAYKIMINPGVCTAAAVAAQSPPATTLFLHVEKGGTTYETLTINNAADGSPII